MSSQRGRIFKTATGYGYYFSITVNGKRQQYKKQKFATKNDAEKALTKALSLIDGGRYTNAGKQTVEQFFISWLTDYERSGRVKQTTLASVNQHVTKYIIPHLGKVLLTKLTTSTLSKFYGDLLHDGRRKPNQFAGKGLSPKTVRNIHLTLAQALTDAVRWQLLPTNPASTVDLPRYDRSALTVFDDQQTGQFLQHLENTNDQFAALWRLAFVTGMRRGELAGLRWVDVDLVSGRVTVAQTRTIANDQVVISTPKTAAGSRHISIDTATVTALANLKNKQETAAELLGGWATDLVAASLDGHAMHPKALLRYFQKAVEAAGLPKLRLHDARHTGATSALQNGTALHVVAGRIGHADVSTTLNIYAHYLPSADKLAADTIGSVLDQAQKVAKGSRKVAADMELGEHDNTVKPYNPINRDFTTLEKPENSGSPGARTLDLRIKSPLLYQLS
jgi:integrase